MITFSDKNNELLKKHLKEKNLTKREIGVFLMVIKGITNKQVADQLFIAEKTVKFHLTSIYKKLKISRRTQLFWTIPFSDIFNVKEEKCNINNVKKEEKCNINKKVILPFGVLTVS